METRVYARGIVPFFVLFSVVVLRVDLVLVSVISGDISLLTWGGRSVANQGQEESRQTCGDFTHFLLLGAGGGTGLERRGESCGARAVEGEERGADGEAAAFYDQARLHHVVQAGDRARSRECACVDRFSHASRHLPSFIKNRLAATRFSRARLPLGRLAQLHGMVPLFVGPC